jgi:hypothetical protein
MQLCFVSVHGLRETYFVDEPRIKKVFTCAQELGPLHFVLHFPLAQVSPQEQS